MPCRSWPKPHKSIGAVSRSCSGPRWRRPARPAAAGRRTKKSSQGCAAPEGETRGLPRFYATALQCCGDAEGVLVALLVLLLLSASSALLSLGDFNTVANVGIAVIKASLVMIFFMRLRSASSLVRLVSLAGFAWLAMLIVLTVADFLARAPSPPPW